MIEDKLDQLIAAVEANTAAIYKTLGEKPAAAPVKDTPAPAEKPKGKSKAAPLEVVKTPEPEPAAEETPEPETAPEPEVEDRLLTEDEMIPIRQMHRDKSVATKDLAKFKTGFKAMIVSFGVEKIGELKLSQLADFTAAFEALS
jgi:outer membrane biosynthesis protein TonB